MNAQTPVDQLFEQRLSLPDSDVRDRYLRLVGLDDHKARLTKMLGVLINPAGLKTWADRHHQGAPSAISRLATRPPLIVLAGDVGSGKTELAETVGDAVAREQGIDVTVFPLSLSTRGQGRVGEMTQLVAGAFDTVAQQAERLKSSSGKARGGVILLIDEADALAQSREASQMHHEDRAGVNALIRGINRFASKSLPAAVIMCTNRLLALDPAVQRRAAEILIFERPNDQQRQAVLSPVLAELGLPPQAIAAIVEATGKSPSRPYGFTFSDLTQRLIPAIVLDAYPASAVTAARAVQIAKTTPATPPFQG